MNYDGVHRLGKYDWVLGLPFLRRPPEAQSPIMEEVLVEGDKEDQPGFLAATPQLAVGL